MDQSTNPKDVQHVQDVHTSLDPSRVPPPGSPFDALRRVRADGSEYWSARDLMPHLEYVDWRNFEAAVDRARAACVNAGHQVTDHLVASTSDGGRWGTGLADFQLSRFGAYLVAMNGDPRKEAIARAQMYFAVKTREAETRPALPQSLPDALRAYAAEVEAREAAAKYAEEMKAIAVQAEEHVAELLPKAEAYGQFLDLTGLFTVATAAQALDTGQIRLFTYLRQHGVLISGGQRHNHPKQQHIDAQRFDLKETGSYLDSKGNRMATFTTMVTPKGLGYIRDLIEKHGRTGL